MSTRGNGMKRGLQVVILAKLAGATVSMTAFAAPVVAGDNPAMLQWFENKWYDMERRLPDWFTYGWGSVWLPPVTKGRDTSSAGYDPFDRFDLGSPSSPTAYGTAAYFDALVDEFHRADGLVYIDSVMNHNSGRDGSSGFQQAGGWPGFWMSPNPGFTTKQATDNWGDFHNGVAGGYLQSENPSGARYDLYKGDLVALVDIAQESNNQFIRQPVAAGNPLNIPAGTVYNQPNPANAQFYPNRNLPGASFTNPGTARNPGSNNFTLYPFDGMNGTPVAENGTGLLLRWSQWMMDVHKVDGFRIDAIKHVPSWFWDTFWDAAVYQRRTTPDGRKVTPFSFGESVESNQFTYDNFIRKTNNIFRQGDSWGNRDALDLNGAGQLRDLINGNGLGSWQNVLNAHLDNQDGFNDGTLGVNHVFSHDNGSAGNGGSLPPLPSAQAQGMYAHAYLLTRSGQPKVYHNALGLTRASGFFPRQGMPTAMGWNPATNSTDQTLIRLVQIHNWVCRGEFNVLNSTDPGNTSTADVLVFERRTNLGFNSYSGNALIATNDRYDSGTQTRFVRTSFSTGTRLIELTGNAADPTVDPTNAIPDVITTTNFNSTGGWATVVVPNNASSAGTHNKGYLVYAPSIPSGTLTLTPTSSTIAADTNFTPTFRRRLTPLPVVSANSFNINLTTSNGDVALVGQPGANNNTDDNALFKIGGGYRDFNANGVVDFDHTTGIAAGYEQFLTLKDPLAGKPQNVNQGNYSQTVNTSLLDEGVHYLSVVAFRKRTIAGEAALFREFRQAFYVDRLPPDASILNIPVVPSGAPTYAFSIKANDRTVNRTHLMQNLATNANPVTSSNSFNQATQNDRFDYSRSVTFVNGVNRITLVAFELSGNNAVKDYYVNYFTTCPGDFNADGFVDDTDFVSFADFYNELTAMRGDLNGDLQTDDSDFVIFATAYNELICP